MALFRLLVLALTFAACSAWISPNNPPIRSESSIGSKSSQDRREFLTRLVIGSATAPWLVPSPAAAAASQDQKDKENIVKGYNRLQYFLDNWEDETTVCNTGQEVRGIASIYADFLCMVPDDGTSSSKLI